MRHIPSGRFCARPARRSSPLIPLLLLFLVPILVAPSALGAMGLGETPLPFDHEILTGRLENGLTYFVREHGEPAGRASLRLVINAGSVLEDEDQRGLAHFVEHMAFNGTEDFAQSEIVDYLESIGMQFGPEVNAYVSFDETVYMIEVPTDSPEPFERAFHILQQWADALTFEPEEIDKERGVIVEEWRFGRDFSARIGDELYPALFGGSRYADRLPIGDMDIVREFERETLVRYYEDWYRPDLMAVIAVGDFRAEDAVAHIQDYFGAIPAPPRPRPRPTFTIPDHDGARYVIVADPELAYSQVSVYNKVDRVEPQTREGYRRLVLQQLYQTLMNTRLEEVARDPDTPFLFAATGRQGLTRSTGANYATAVVQPGDIEAGLRRLLAELRSVEQEGFTPEELERGKSNVLRNMENLYRERENVENSSFAAEYTRHFLTGEPVPGIPAEWELFQDFVPGITLEEVNALAGDVLVADNRIILVATVESEDHTPPTEDQLAAVVDGVDDVVVERREERELADAIVSEIPAPGQSRIVTQHEELGLTQLRLSNGIRVYLRPTDFQEDEVRISAFSPGGTSVVSDDDFVDALLATSVVTEAGVADLSAVELSRRLAGRLVEVAPYIDTNFEGFSGASSVEDLELLFELLYAYATEPRRDDAAVDRYLQRLTTLLQNRENSPDTRFSDRLTELYTGGDQRSRPMDTDRLASFSYDNALEIYRERFADLDDLVVVIVGNADLETVADLSERYLATLPTEPGGETWVPREAPHPEERVAETMEAGIEPQSTVAILFHGDAEWSRIESHRLTSLADYLRIRLREVLREDEGGTYGVGVGAQMSRIPTSRYLFQVTFRTDPARARELTDLVYQVVEDVAGGSVSEDDVGKVREAQLRSYETALEDNGFWLSNLTNLLRNGRDVGDILDFETLPTSLTAADIADAASRYLRFQQSVELIRYPED